MLRKLTWLSLILLVLTGIYCVVAQRVGASFRNLSGDSHFPTGSFSVGKTEFAMPIDQRYLMLWIVRSEDKQALPLIGKYGILDVIFNRMTTEVQWRRFLLIGGVGGFNGKGDSRLPVQVTYVLIGLWELMALFALLPLIAATRIIYRKAMYSFRARAIAKRRCHRESLSLCACGYDLRHTHGRCPECGRTVRWVPVAIGVAKYH